jgi:hypothetical protein
MMTVHPPEAEPSQERADHNKQRSRSGAVFTASYEIRVKGRLSEAMQAAFEEFEITTEPVETVLHGQVLDQAALHGLLDRIQALGLELVEVRRLAAGEPGPPEIERAQEN